MPAMAQPSQPPEVLLICGMLSTRGDWLEEATAALQEAFGPVAAASEVIAFEWTGYYDEQMGCPLLRQFVAFDRLARGDALAAAKCLTNDLEARFAAEVGPTGPPRPVNLDVGYVTGAKLVLASMKDFSHRIYLAHGVFAEVTLLYQGGRWQRLPWTFPDYASGRYDAFLDEARRLHRSRVREKRA
jgi:hypothetical protein